MKDSSKNGIGCFFPLLALGSFFVAWHEYSAITKWEQEGGEYKTKLFLSWLYNVFGVWGVVGVFLLFGIWLCY